jgi:hypothetical protein
MCRSIQPLHNYEPPTTAEEIRSAALQYVRKVSGMTRPARVNEAAFDRAVESVAQATRQMLDGFVALSPPHDRRVERQRARALWERRQATNAPAGGSSGVGP